MKAGLGPRKQSVNRNKPFDVFQDRNDVEIVQSEQTLRSQMVLLFMLKRNEKGRLVITKHSIIFD